MNMSKNSISYYGKIPSHGDFISHFAPRTFTEVWDEWLQKSLVHWRSELGERWVADYLTMLPYRFILSSGIAGEVVWCGIMFASRDYAGRLFPFTVCVPLSATKTNPFQLFDTCQQWLGELESIATRCVIADFKKEDLQGGFQQALDELTLKWSDSIVQDVSHTCLKTSEASVQDLFAWHSKNVLNASSTVSLSDLSYPMLDTVLSEFCHSYSLWWTRDNNDFSLCQGLPAKEMTLAFIDKQWRQRGWLLHE